MDEPERKTDRHDAGYTLIELLIGITLMLLVLAAGLTLLQIVTRSEPAIREANASIQDAQIAAERMTRELRQTYAVNSASPTSLSVDTYLQQSSSCAGTGGSETARQCRVAYTCGSSSCTRTVSEVNGTGAQTATVITGLTSTDVFSYSPSAAEPISISLTLQLAGEGSDDAITISDGVVLRNVSGAVGS
ncbi:MAG TPA: prepilin-type N-terminal cleavage/methylation domain-containing protein [Solirubrobacterales bacterium]|nr:prepilin-type N-terminal cleavage/methylation domain-containing protein [Solirubrobacterales bacterium]